MPRPRFENLSQERRRELLTAAAQEFAQHGYQAASLNGIITSVGLSKGAFYYYFDDKADLFDTVARFAFSEVVDTNQRSFDLEALDADDFWPKARDWYRFTMERVHERPWLAGLGKLVYEPPHVDGIDQLVADHFEEMRAWLTRFLRRGRALGTVRDDLPLTLLQLVLIGAMEGSDRWFVEHWESLETGERDELGDRVFDIARSILQPPSRPRAIEASRAAVLESMET